MKVQRLMREISAFTTRLGAVVFKTVVTSAVVGMVLVSVMHYMGVPIPSTHDLLRGVARLAHNIS